MANDAPDPIESSKIATDIVQNLERVKANNNDADALKALQADAALLSPVTGPFGNQGAMDMQRSVQNDVNKLIADGSLPKVEIIVGPGNIVSTVSELKVTGGKTNTNVLAQPYSPASVTIDAPVTYGHGNPYPRPVQHGK